MISIALRRSRRAILTLAPLTSLLSLICAVTVHAGDSSATVKAASDTPPNIVMIMVDDAGLMDLQPFGGEARMPNIQALADRGVRFTGYRSSPLCAPSRAMFLTGIDNHLNGVATIPEVIPAEHKGAKGYSLALEPGVKTIADRLRDAGYRTFMTGKWHMGSREVSELPVSHGFDRSFVLDASGADNWEQKPYTAFDRVAPWFEDAEPAELPENFYSSKFIVDKMIDYLSPRSNQPFLAYLAFQAIHIPIQAPREFTEHYAGVYDAGWHALREARWHKAQSLGIIPEDAPLGEMHEGHRPWDSLSEEERRYYTRAMMVNAGMLEAMDHHVGRLISWLDSRGELENTLFIVTSDNGPEHNDIVNTPGMGLWYALSDYNRNVETMGEKNSLVSIGPEWASAAASPGKLFKFYSSSGGIRVPLILAGPGLPVGTSRDSFAMVTDVAPTLLELVGADQAHSDSEISMTGRSLLPAILNANAEVYGQDESVGMEVSGNAALFKGTYKLSRNTKPHGDGMWRLFDIENDPGETRDLATEDPTRVAELARDYASYASNMGVQDVADNYEPIKQFVTNTIHVYLDHCVWELTAAMLTAIAAVIFIILVVIRRRKRHN